MVGMSSSNSTYRCVIAPLSSRAVMSEDMKDASFVVVIVAIVNDMVVVCCIVMKLNCVSEPEEDTWDDEEETTPAPKVICTCRVIKDHIPETNDLLTLISLPFFFFFPFSLFFFVVSFYLYSLSIFFVLFL